MEERHGTDTQFGSQVSREHLAHRPVLREYQRAIAVVDDLGDHFRCAVELSGSSVEVVRIAGDLRRVIAYLLEGGQKRKDVAAPGNSRTQTGVESICNCRPIDARLFRRQSARDGGELLGRKILGHCVFGSAQNEGIDDRGKPGRRGGRSTGFDRYGKALTKPCASSEDFGIGDAKERPQFFETVLHRRAGHRYLDVGRQLHCGLRCQGRGVLDLLRLVEDH